MDFNLRFDRKLLQRSSCVSVWLIQNRLSNHQKHRRPILLFCPPVVQHQQNHNTLVLRRVEMFPSPAETLIELRTQISHTRSLRRFFHRLLEESL